MVMDFRAHYGTWALVAGASEGLGAEFATGLAARGLNVVLVARRQEQLAALAGHLAAAHGIQARALPLDLARPESAAAILEHTRDLDLGLLVYNAAYSVIGPFLEHSLEDHLKELQVNCRAPLELAHGFGKRFIARGRGGIILLSSLSASQGSALITHYAATKAYNRLLAEGLWEELRDRGVHVLACRPGATRTPNYVASLSDRPAREPAQAMAPGAVVAEALNALGRQPSVIPGRMNRLASLVMERVLPRETAIRFMGRVLRRMYSR